MATTNIFVQAFLRAAETCLNLSAEAEKRGEMAEAYRLIAESKQYSQKAERIMK